MKALWLGNVTHAVAEVQCCAWCSAGFFKDLAAGFTSDTMRKANDSLMKEVFGPNWDSATLVPGHVANAADLRCQRAILYCANAEDPLPKLLELQISHVQIVTVGKGFKKECADGSCVWPTKPITKQEKMLHFFFKSQQSQSIKVEKPAELSSMSINTMIMHPHVDTEGPAPRPAAHQIETTESKIQTPRELARSAEIDEHLLGTTCEMQPPPCVSSVLMHTAGHSSAHSLSSSDSQCVHLQAEEKMPRKWWHQRRTSTLL